MASATSSPLKQARAEQRRVQALHATLELIRSRGVGAVTMRAVAAESGVPIGSLTYYFADKEEMLANALELWVEEETAKATSLAQSIEDEGITAEEATARFAEFLTSYDPEQIAQFDLYLYAARTPELRGYDEAVTEILRAGGIADPERAAPLLLAIADGLGMRRVAAPDGSPDLAKSLLAAVRMLEG
jgi:DNA-binding transcriptional regulator YbjK